MISFIDVYDYVKRLNEQHQGSLILNKLFYNKIS